MIFIPFAIIYNYYTTLTLCRIKHLKNLKDCRNNFDSLHVFVLLNFFSRPLVPLLLFLSIWPTKKAISMHTR